MRLTSEASCRLMAFFSFQKESIPPSAGLPTRLAQRWICQQREVDRSIMPHKVSIIKKSASAVVLFQICKEKKRAAVLVWQCAIPTLDFIALSIAYISDANDPAAYQMVPAVL